MERCKHCGEIHPPATEENEERLDRLHAEANNLSIQLMNRYSPADTMYILALTSSIMTVSTKPRDTKASKETFLEVYTSFVDELRKNIQ